MPASTSTSNPAPQDRPDESSADEFLDAPTLRSKREFEAVFKAKHKYVKKRTTMLDNAIRGLEADDVSVHPDDIDLAKTYLKALTDALDKMNEVLEENTSLLTEEEADTKTDLYTDYITQIMAFRSRINKVSPTVPPPPVVVQAPVPQVHKKKYRIDDSFKPHDLDTTATPAFFDKWRKEFMVYMRRNELDQAPVDEQRIILNNCLTSDMETDLSKVCLLEPDASIQDIMKSLQEYFCDSNNLIWQRYQYFQCSQHEDESIRKFIARFRSLGDYADLENFQYQDNMACKLITGVKDEELRSELLRLKDTSFDAVKKHALSWEASRVHSGKYTDSKKSLSNNATSTEVNKVSTYKSNKQKTFRKHNSKASGNQDSKPTSHNRPSQDFSSFRCQNCGFRKHKSNTCPAKEQQCDYCHKMGHFSKVCKQRMAPTNKGSNNRKGSNVRALVNDMDSSESQDEDTDDQEDGVNIVNFDVCKIHDESNRPRSTPKVDITFVHSDKVLGSRKVLPDTGASVSVMPKTLANQWELVPTPIPSTVRLKSVDGAEIPCDGMISLNLRFGDAETRVDFYVCPGVVSLLLSWYALRSLRVVPADFPTQIPLSEASVKTLRGNDSEFDYAKYFHKLYPRVFEQASTLKVMKGPEMKIYLKNDINLTEVKQVFKPRQVPIPLVAAAKTQIETMLQQHIIRPITGPTNFVSPLVVVPKKNNTVRLVVDYKELNKYVKRPTHPFPSVSQVRALIPPNAKYFAIMDAVQGYWQIPLHRKSQELTTFLTPWGRFCFTRAPMGLISSGDEFCQRGDAIFSAVPNMIKVIDDILVYASSRDELIASVHRILRAAQENNISLSLNKFKMGTSVPFVGLIVSDQGITPDPKHLKAIANFPVPTSKTDLRSFMGLINQFTNFSKDIAALSQPFRHLLTKQSVWQWDQSHDLAFKQVREALLRAPILQFFDVSKRTKLLTDASKLKGLGYALMQKSHHDDSWGLVACGSRFLTATESNYAVCEIEALAIAWAIRKCKVFLLGLPHFQVHTDHRPLVSIFNATTLARHENPRLLRLMQQVAMYSFHVHWIPGRHNKIPDALSRAPVLAVSNATNASRISSALAVSAQVDKALLPIMQAATTDDKYQDLVHAVKGMSHEEVKKMPVSTHSHVRQFLSIWSRLSIHNGSRLVILDCHRIIVPVAQRSSVLQKVHAAHQGITRTRARMQSLYFWPGMSNDVVQTVQNCELCQKLRDSQPGQPISVSAQPSRPFQCTSCDIFEFKGCHCLVYVDRFSGWPLLATFNKSPSSGQLIAAFSTFFQDFGIPNNLRHDGARNLVSEEFKNFLKQHNIIDELSSAYNPTSNGHAEATVKALKLIVKKCWINKSFDKHKLFRALLEYRCTPKLPGGLSPAEMVFGRRIRSLAPTIIYKRFSHNQIYNANKRNYLNLESKYSVSNSSRRALPPLKVGDAVRIRDSITGLWDKNGSIIQVRPGARSYFVQYGSKTLLRNRRFLKSIKQKPIQ